MSTYPGLIYLFILDIWFRSFIFLFCQSSIVGNLFLIVQGLQSMNLLKAVILGKNRLIWPGAGKAVGGSGGRRMSEERGWTQTGREKNFACVKLVFRI